MVKESVEKEMKYILLDDVRIDHIIHKHNFDVVSTGKKSKDELYFDTTNFDLYRSGISFRYDITSREFTIKIPLSKNERKEMEIEYHGGLETLLYKARELLKSLKLSTSDNLQVIGRVITHRESYIIRYKSSTFEVSLDKRLIFLGPQEYSLDTLEIELIKGLEEDLYTFSDRFISSIDPRYIKQENRSMQQVLVDCIKNKCKSLF